MNFYMGYKLKLGAREWWPFFNPNRYLAATWRHIPTQAVWTLEVNNREARWEECNDIDFCNCGQ